MTSVLHCVPAHVVEPSAAVLASLDDSVLFQVSLTTQTKCPKVHVTQQKAQAIRIGDLPDEVMASAIHKHFTSRDLCSMAQVSPKYRGLSVSPASELDRVDKRLQVVCRSFGDACSHPTPSGRLCTSKPLARSLT